MFIISIEHFVHFILYPVMTMIYPRIRELREDADLTQAAVGRAINVPQRTYAYYESGQRMIPPPVLPAQAPMNISTTSRFLSLNHSRRRKDFNFF